MTKGGFPVKNGKVNMLSGSITKGLLAMTMPIITMGVMASLFNLIDMTVLRFYADDSAVGAAGASGTIITVCTTLITGISVGSNVIVAKHIGAGNKTRVDNAVMTSFLLSLALGFLFMVAGVASAESVLKLTNCPDSLLAQATLYFRLTFYGIPITTFYSFCASILRATGDTKRPLYFSILSGIIKILLTLLFVAVFDLSIAGVVHASNIASIVIGILAFCALLRSNDAITVNFKKIRFDPTELKGILQVGIPIGLQSALYSLANVVIATAVNSFGADATTGISIANRFDGVMYQIIHAPSVATIPFVAQNIGAGNIKRVKQIITKSILITTVFGVTFGSLSAVFSEQLSSLLSSSPAVIEFSRQKMIIISSTYFICGINEVIGGVLKGMGKPIYPTIATLIFMCLFRFVWVYAIFPLCPNLTFLYLVWPIGWVLSIAALLIVYFTTIAKLQKKAESLNNPS